MGAPSPDQDIAAIRRNYQRASLRSVDLDADPVEQFRRWLQQAIAADLQESTAMVLSTFDGKRPSSRTVLLKACLLYTSPSPRDATLSRMPSSA